MDECGEKSPWICHICDHSGLGESQSCALCYMVTCPAHLQIKMIFNKETGLYELLPVCLCCATPGLT